MDRVIYKDKEYEVKDNALDLKSKRIKDISDCDTSAERVQLSPHRRIHVIGAQ